MHQYNLHKFNFVICTSYAFCENNIQCTLPCTHCTTHSHFKQIINSYFIYLNCKFCWAKAQHPLYSILLCFTHHMDINIDKNCHHVLEINQHKFHYLCMDLVNKHRFLHNVSQQNRYNIGIRILPVK